MDSTGLLCSPADLTAVFPVPAGLLSSFVEVESIKRHFKSRLVGTVLNGYLCLRKLVLQRTKLIDETQDMLLEMLEDMTTGNPIGRRGAGEIDAHKCRFLVPWHQMVTELRCGRGVCLKSVVLSVSPRAGLRGAFPVLSSYRGRGGGLGLVSPIIWDALIVSYQWP